MVYGYGRHSPLDIGLASEGLLAQEMAIREYCRVRFPLQPVQVGLDGPDQAARTLLSRAEGRRLNLALAQGHSVVFARFDRSFADLADMAAVLQLWDARGVYIHSVQDGVDTSAPEWAGFCATLGLCRRLQSIRLHEQSAGKLWGGKAALGFKLDLGGKAVPDDEQRSLMGEIVRLRDEEGLDYWQIVRRLPELKKHKQPERAALERYQREKLLQEAEVQGWKFTPQGLPIVDGLYVPDREGRLVEYQQPKGGT